MVVAIEATSESLHQVAVHVSQLIVGEILKHISIRAKGVSQLRRGLRPITLVMYFKPPYEDLVLM